MTQSMMEHAAFLDIMARAAVERIKAQAEALLPALGAIEVLKNHSGLVMLPMRDTISGTAFHLGEVLVAEAHIRLVDHDVEAYGMVTGHDLEQAMAMAVLDAAFLAGIETERLMQFAHQEATRQRHDDEKTLRYIEATRVNMETC